MNGSEDTLLVDVSLYNEDVDYGILAANGVAGLIAKASQGYYSTDPLFTKHIEGAKKAGMVTGAYH